MCFGVENGVYRLLPPVLSVTLDPDVVVGTPSSPHLA